MLLQKPLIIIKKVNPCFYFTESKNAEIESRLVLMYALLSNHVREFAFEIQYRD